MNIITISLLGITIALMALVLRSVRPDYAVLMGIIFGVAVILFITPRLGEIVSQFKDIANSTGISDEILTASVKVVGISLIAEFAVSVCNDVGEIGIAQKIEVAAKIIMLSLALPLVKSAVDGIFGILP